MNYSECKSKKKFLRHIEQPLPKNVIIERKVNELESSTVSEQSLQSEPTHTQTKPIPVVPIDLNEPKKNFAKCIEKQIDKLGKLEIRKLNSRSDLTRDQRVTYDEKITKQINVPFDKKLYKELISLKLHEKKRTSPILQPLSANYETIRDRVPKLEDFYVPVKKPEYSIPVISNLGSPTTTRNYDGLRMHKLMVVWKNDKYL